jgi:hypothetical protein
VAGLWPLVSSGLPYWPEFLVPASLGKSPSFADELTQLSATPEEPVRASLRRVFGDGSWPQIANDLFERSRATLAELAAELAECHDRLIVPHWERIRSVLEADIAYHAGLLAGGGARSLFGDLHPSLRWSGDKLYLTDSDDEADGQVTLGPDGVVLMPSVFIWHLAVLHRGGLADRQRSGHQASALGLVVLGRAQPDDGADAEAIP